MTMKVKEGKQSFDIVFHQHKKRIYYYLHQLNIPYKLHDEFYAEGLIALWEAYEQYDPSKGNLTTYLNYRIRFKMIDLIRKKERKKQAHESYLEAQKQILMTGNRDRGANFPLLDYTDSIDIRDEQFWQYIRNQLTDRQWKWVYYYVILGYSLREIAERENVTIEAVKGWAKMTRKKLKQDEVLKKWFLI